MKDKKQRLVSCLCVTHERVPFLQRAIQCFSDQTHLEKELIILHQRNDTATATFLEQFEHELNLRIIVVDDGISLGEKRNIAIESSNGEFFCQWDDDDWYHNRRIELQLKEAIENGKDVSALAYKLMYDAVNEKAYLSNLGPWPNTVLCNKHACEKHAKYPGVNKGEDYEFMGQLYTSNLVYPIIKPSLYIYTFHGNNTWEEYHFRDFFNQSQLLPAWIVAQIKRIINGEVSGDVASDILFSTPFLKELNYIRQRI